MEFKIEKRVVRVPTDFVVINGTRLNWSDFTSSLKALEAFAKTPISRRDLRHLLQTPFDANWVKAWSARGVVTPYNDHWDNDGRSLTTEMVKAGPSYKPFMNAVRAFQTTLHLEAAVNARADKRARLQTELADLDKPVKARKGLLKNPYFDPLFEV